MTTTRNNGMIITAYGMTVTLTDSQAAAIVLALQEAAVTAELRNHTATAADYDAISAAVRPLTYLGKMTQSQTPTQRV